MVPVSKSRAQSLFGLVSTLAVASGCAGDTVVYLSGAESGGPGPVTGGTADGAGVTTGGTMGGTTAAGAPTSVSLSATGTETQGTAPPVVPAECQGVFANGAVDGAVHSVVVASTESWGPLPHFWSTYGTGHLGLYVREDRGWGETLQAHTVDGVANLGLTSVRQHGLFHDDIGIYHEEGGVPVYDFTISDQIFDFFVEQGISPIVELAPMPSDLAADPSQTVFDWNMITSPPKDYALWQALVTEFVRHSIERYGVETVSRWSFEVWNEPECCGNKFWAGSLEDYYRLYDYAAAGVRAALPDGRVGGPVASQPVELTAGSAVGRGFLEHVTTVNDAQPGELRRLDFFSYHSWSFIDGAVNGYFQGLDLLESFGFGAIPIAITEFGPTYEFDLFEEPQEMDQGAAFVAQTYADISRRAALENRRFPLAYSWWTLSDVFEEGLYQEGNPFIGAMGLISREDIKKPAYNAFKFLARLGDEQVAFSVEGQGDVGGMAARSPDGGVQVIIYNGQNPGLGPQDGTYYAVTEPQSIGVTISDLTADLPYDVSAFRVDKTRGNAYAAWQEMGRPAMDAMSEADWQSLRDVMESPEEVLDRSVCGTTFTQSFDLPSPGVLFVELTPTPPIPLE